MNELVASHWYDNCDCMKPESTARQFNAEVTYYFSVNTNNENDPDFAVTVPPCRPSYSEKYNSYGLGGRFSVAVKTLSLHLGRAIWRDDEIHELFSNRDSDSRWLYDSCMPVYFGRGHYWYFARNVVSEAKKRECLTFERCQVCGKKLRGKCSKKTCCTSCLEVADICDGDATHFFWDEDRDGRGQCVVYFIEKVGVGHVKIGITSRDIAKRIAGLQQSMELKLLGTIPGDCVMEKALHDRFSELNIRGEWFFLTHGLRRFIKAVVSSRR